MRLPRFGLRENPQVPEKGLNLESDFRLWYITSQTVGPLLRYSVLSTALESLSDPGVFLGGA
jgi:hypothetical protein